LLPISENETLFQLIGTTYGGDGQSTFALPNLSSRLPIHFGSGSGLSSYALSQTGGVEQVTLTTAQIPSHTHQLVGSTTLSDQESPQNAMTGQTEVPIYGTPLRPQDLVSMSPQIMTSVGGNQPHDNLQPYVVINFIISLFGIFPSPT
jgi:microcystin-dependent protein